MKIYLFPKRRGEKVGKKTPSFDFIISHCGEGVLLRGGRTEMLKRRTSVSSGSRWSSVDMIHFIIAHLNRPVARVCISLSSGISMFARES